MNLIYTCKNNQKPNQKKEASCVENEENANIKKGAPIEDLKIMIQIYNDLFFIANIVIYI